MNEIFDLIYKLLKWISALTGLTYREVNIIVYFIIIPAFFIFLISKILNKKHLIFGFIVLILILFLIIPDFEIFSDKLFNLSVDFLNWFEHIGLNYVQASVVICVIVPILIITLLLYLNKSRAKSEVEN